MKKNRKKKGQKVDFEIAINEAEQKIIPKLCMLLVNSGGILV